MTEDASETQASVGRTILTVAGYLAGVLGFLSILAAGLMLAVWSWLAVGSVIDVPWLVHSGLTLIMWLVATTLLPAVPALVLHGVWCRDRSGGLHRRSGERLAGRRRWIR